MMPAARTVPGPIGEDEALSLIDRVARRSTAGEIEIHLSGVDGSLSRYAGNQTVQNVSKATLALRVTSCRDRRRASASTTELDPDAVAATVRRAEEMAEIAPEDPEFVPPLAPQDYPDHAPLFDDATARCTPAERGELVRQVVSRSASAGVEASGTLATGTRMWAVGNSLGLRAYDRVTTADFSCTTRTADGGSAWVNRTAGALGALPIIEMTDGAIERGHASSRPREISPGRYPVILDAAATAELVRWLMWSMDARAADEGRSFMSRMGADGRPDGNRLGEELFSPLVTLAREPAHPLLGLGRFFDNGLPAHRLAFVRAGVALTLHYDRYWAGRQGVAPTGPPLPLVMAGGEEALQDLVAATERAILVTRAWYVRHVNPRTLEVTGLTRDGTFWIEDGRISHPLKNLRFNQNLPELFQNVDAVGEVQRFGNCVAPVARARGFDFVSVTDSV
ncbi:MAG: TldD/PmbA family protein [Alphaproteobacteria bacterium]